MTPQEMLLAADLLEYAAACSLPLRQAIDLEALKRAGFRDAAVRDQVLPALNEWAGLARSQRRGLGEFSNSEWMKFLAARLNRDAVQRLKADV